MEQLELFDSKDTSQLEKTINHLGQTKIGQLAKKYWEVPIVVASTLPWTSYGNIYGNLRSYAAIVGPFVGLGIAGNQKGERLSRDFMVFFSTLTLGTSSLDSVEGIVFGLTGAAAAYGAVHYNRKLQDI